MGKILSKLTENKPLLAVIKIVVLLTFNTLLFRFIISGDFLHIDPTHFFEKYVNNETLSLSQWFVLVWNDNVQGHIIYSSITGLIGK